MKEELLSPSNLEKEIEKRLKNLQTTLMEKEKEINKKLEGHLRIAQRHGRSQFYHYTESSNPKGRYIPLKEKAFAYKLAQKDYDTEVIILIQKEIDTLQNYLSQTGGGRAISELYDSLCPARRSLITPVTLTDEQYAASWQEVSWTGRPFAPDAPLLYTAHGERVRSKSEVIIADTLFRHKIPYRYEFPITLRRNSEAPFHGDFDKLNHRNSGSGDTVTLYPDFLCLNTRTRSEFFWEHFGLMDDSDYSKNAAGKLRLYTENGILAGRNLIITMETQTEPPSIKALEKLIEEFLL